MTAFGEWKARAMHRLISISQQYRDAESEHFIKELIMRLDNLRARDISRYMSRVYIYSGRIPEVLDIIPTTEEIEAILRESGAD